MIVGGACHGQKVVSPGPASRTWTAGGRGTDGNGRGNIGRTQTAVNCWRRLDVPESRCRLIGPSVDVGRTAGLAVRPAGRSVIIRQLGGRKPLLGSLTGRR